MSPDKAPDVAAAYNAIFEILATAEMQLRNGNYWQVFSALQQAAKLAKDYAMRQGIVR